jgi:hypothetical protein
LELKVQQGLTGDLGSLAACGEHHPSTGTSAGRGADGRSFSASGNRPDGRAYSTPDSDFRGVAAFGGSRKIGNGIGRDANHLTAHLQTRQAYREASKSIDPTTLIGFDNSSFQLRSSRGDFLAAF